jgi:hypothetical protein
VSAYRPPLNDFNRIFAIEQKTTGRREGGKREIGGSRASRQDARHKPPTANLLLASREIFLVLVPQKQKCVLASPAGLPLSIGLISVGFRKRSLIEAGSAANS